MMISDNGVGWSPPEPYATSRPWTLSGNDGPRRVFARYRSGLGFWSGSCFDSILLDTTAPRVSASPTGGTYMEAQYIALTASEPSTIRYTLDGSDPANSPTAQTYGAPILITTDAKLSAIATDAVGLRSGTLAESYEICTGTSLGLSGYVFDATRQNSPMPLVVISLETGQTATTNTSGYYTFPPATGLVHHRFGDRPHARLRHLPGGSQAL